MTRPQRQSAIKARFATQNSIAAINPAPGVKLHNNPKYPEHAVYIYKNQLFNANDCRDWLDDNPPLPQDGFHTGRWLKYDRPLMLYKYSLHHSRLTDDGECALFANTIAKVIRNIGIVSFLVFMREHGKHPDVGVRLLEFSSNLPRGKK